MNKDPSAIARFRRAYSVTIFNVIFPAGAFAASNLGADSPQVLYSFVGVVVAALTLLPFILRDGFSGNIRLAVSISVLWTLVFGMFIAWLIYDFIKIEFSDRIPPDGWIFGMIVFVPLLSFACFCPWLITLLRGVRCLTTKPIEISEHQEVFQLVEQGADGKPPEADQPPH